MTSKNNSIDLNSPLQRFYFGAMFAGLFGVFLYLANLEHAEDTAVHAELATETTALGRTAPDQAPEGMPVLVTFDISGEKEVCDQDLGWCLRTVAYQRDVETWIRNASIDTRHSEPKEGLGNTTYETFWAEQPGNPKNNPDPFPGIRFARAVSDTIDTRPRWKLSEDAMAALLERPGAVLSDNEIDPADTTLNYAGDGWWRPNAPDDPELGEQRMRVRTLPAGTYSLLGAVEDGQLVPADIEKRDVILAAEGAVDIAEMTERTSPDSYVLSWKNVFLTGIMAIGVCIALTAFFSTAWLVIPLGILLSAGISGVMAFVVT